jgi:hypothetical protein
MEHRFTNALNQESSPYLLQHAHNPVNWLPWGEEALARARQEDKPIIVSIGYSACHWCHVMERESFENESVAAYMNDHFVNIKIDREERPDLDQIYMDAVQAISGSGGWPLNVFLTPDGRPFYGGTYFPPAPAFNRPSWMDVLHFMSDAWQNRRAELEEQAGKLIDHIHSANHFYAGLEKNIAVPETEQFVATQCRTMREAIMATADQQEGGFGRAPKFPQTFTIQYLLAHSAVFQDDDALQQAELSLRKMLRGGIYDHIAGGLARYSTDTYWLVPHFEKMLYDNAQLVMVLADAARLTGKQFYREAIDKTLQFLLYEMRHPDGGFYAALDADSEGEEGKFYVWGYEEFGNVLKADAGIMARYYGVTDSGNWEGNNILTRQADEEVFARENGLSLQELAELTASANEKLLRYRNRRVRPQTDDKIILGWNALALTAMCKGYAVLGREAYKQEAIALAAFIREHFCAGGTEYRHTYKNGMSRYPAFLDDYAYLIQALISLQEITSDQSYLREASELAAHVWQHFSDPETGLCFYTPVGQADLVARKVDIFDNATASGNSIMAANLQYLSVVFERSDWAGMARKMIAAVLPLTLRYPGSLAVWGYLILQQVAGLREIVVTGRGYDTMRDRLLSEYIPFSVLQSSDYEKDMPLFKHRQAEGLLQVFVCRNNQCLAPASDWGEIQTLIKITTI